jgi:hypothetical protein
MRLQCCAKCDLGNTGRIDRSFEGGFGRAVVLDYCVEGATCDVFSGLCTETADNRQMFVATGDPCEKDSDCIDGNDECATKEAFATKICTPASKLGESCFATDNCQYSTVCISSICTDPQPRGSICSAGNECAYPGICTSGVCSDRLNVGELCEIYPESPFQYQSNNCQLVQRCESPSPGAPNVCRDVTSDGVGGKCNLMNNLTCDNRGTYEIPDMLAPHGVELSCEAGFCVSSTPSFPIGTLCGTNAPAGTTTGCDGDLVCAPTEYDGGKLRCHYPTGVGGNCGAGIEGSLGKLAACLPGTSCQDGKCRGPATAPFGDFCGDSLGNLYTECESAACVYNRCGKADGTGDLCDKPNTRCNGTESDVCGADGKCFQPDLFASDNTGLAFSGPECGPDRLCKPFLKCKNLIDDPQNNDETFMQFECAWERIPRGGSCPGPAPKNFIKLDADQCEPDLECVQYGDRYIFSSKRQCTAYASEGDRCGVIESIVCNDGMKCVLGTCTK